MEIWILIIMLYIYLWKFLFCIKVEKKPKSIIPYKDIEYPLLSSNYFNNINRIDLDGFVLIH